MRVQKSYCITWTWKETGCLRIHKLNERVRSQTFTLSKEGFCVVATARSCRPNMTGNIVKFIYSSKIKRKIVMLILPFVQKNTVSHLKPTQNRTMWQHREIFANRINSTLVAASSSINHHEKIRYCHQLYLKIKHLSRLHNTKIARLPPAGSQIEL